MQPEGKSPLQDGLASLVAQASRGVDGNGSLEAAVAVWGTVDATLSPIIGQRGVAALFERSLHVARATHPCLGAVHDCALRAGDFAALQSVLAQQSAAAADAAHRALLLAFVELLSRLIGAPLTERLLQPVWDQPSSGHSVRDRSP